MPNDIYIEDLLADEELADQVWEAWNKAEISDFWAVWMWWTIAASDTGAYLDNQNIGAD